jgi:Ca2+-binding EF-hand superfamily protein
MISGIDGNLASSWASSLFSKLDTNSQGYLQKSDLESAFSAITGNSDSSNADDVFDKLDINSDGKVTEDEMATALKSLFSNRTSGAGMQEGGPGGPGGAPPPPRGGNDAGFTKDELSSQLQEIGSSDSKRSSLISNIIENFDAADTDKDGKVSMQEAMAYDKANQTSSTASTQTVSDSATSNVDSNGTEDLITKQIMKLLSAYQVFENESSSSNGSGLSISA